MLNYSDFETETIKLILKEYNDWKNILIESKNGSYYDTLLLFDFHCKSYINNWVNWKLHNAPNICFT